MGIRRKRISQSLLIAVLIYTGFVSVLYLRMKHAEKRAAEYSSARPCALSSNCREIVNAEIVDHIFRNVSFRNYGSKGIPLQSGSFQKYIFIVSMGDSENRTVNVLTNIPLIPGDFDLANVYLPGQSDEILKDSDLFRNQHADVEIWQDTITYILVKVNVSNNSAPVGDLTHGETSIRPLYTTTYELVLPTEDHPTVRLQQTKDDFSGWTAGVLFPAALFVVVTGIISGVTYFQNQSVKKRDEDE